MDRLKKMGNPNLGLTSFHMYILKEMELMYRLVVEIKATLQVSPAAARCIQGQRLLSLLC